jgi:hypothetical protein
MAQMGTALFSSFLSILLDGYARHKSVPGLQGPTGAPAFDPKTCSTFNLIDEKTVAGKLSTIECGLNKLVCRDSRDPVFDKCSVAYPALDICIAERTKARIGIKPSCLR